MSCSSALSTLCQEAGRSCAHPLHALHVSVLLQHHALSSPLLCLRLQQRERLLHAGGTLSAHTILLLLRGAVTHGVSLSSALLCHEATLTAEQKQQVMPPGVIVQKTVSLQFSDPRHTLTLVTGLGDFHLTRAHRFTLAASLAIPGKNARNSTINPAGCDPVKLFRMEPGMISPFLAVSQPPIATLGIVTPAALDTAFTHVAISLSLFESLLIPVAAFLPILEEYIQRMFPHIQRLMLPHHSSYCRETEEKALA